MTEASVQDLFCILNEKLQPTAHAAFAPHATQAGPTKTDNGHEPGQTAFCSDYAI
jgi:hypothetical protein